MRILPEFASGLQLTGIMSQCEAVKVSGHKAYAGYLKLRTDARPYSVGAGGEGGQCATFTGMIPVFGVLLILFEWYW